jgi:hypothetical protein
VIAKVDLRKKRYGPVASILIYTVRLPELNRMLKLGDGSWVPAKGLASMAAASVNEAISYHKDHIQNSSDRRCTSRNQLPAYHKLSQHRTKVASTPPSA